MVRRASDSENLRSLANGQMPGLLWRRKFFEGAGLKWAD